MNQQIVDYLQKNKNSYSKEVLIAELQKTGHINRDIDESVKWVYENEKVINYKFWGVIAALIFSFPIYVAIAVTYGAGILMVGFMCNLSLSDRSDIGALLVTFLFEGIFKFPVIMMLGALSGVIANKIGKNNWQIRIITIIISFVLILVASIIVEVIGKNNTIQIGC